MHPVSEDSGMEKMLRIIVEFLTKVGLDIEIKLVASAGAETDSG